jgi:hypothetical protein
VTGLGRKGLLCDGMGVILMEVCGRVKGCGFGAWRGGPWVSFGVFLGAGKVHVVIVVNEEVSESQVGESSWRRSCSLEVMVGGPTFEETTTFSAR